MPATFVRCPNCQSSCELPDATMTAGHGLICATCGAIFVPPSLGAVTPTSGETTLEAPQAVAPTIRTSSPLLWQVGDVVLGLYEVLQVHEGGMGLVYRVRHRAWKLDLAVKTPRPDCFRSDRDKENFEREAETWVQLGLHPHIVSCYYVRRIDGIPRIFAEYVAGGTLTEWIRQGKLYAGTPVEALARILDVAIQFAWGLHHAHEQGLVHQDVKPGNLLLTPRGVAKVTDFGLARALGAAAALESGSEQTLLVTSGGLTPAYCSPEQARRQPVSRKTDVWSWAVSVLEMSTGSVTWTWGHLAGRALEQHLREGKPRPGVPLLPRSLGRLLRQCLHRRPEARPGSMLEIAVELQEIYAKATGHAYPRSRPRTAEALAANLNNRAVSLLDLGKREAAEPLWEEALALEPHHPESAYNLGLHRWRRGRLTTEMLLKQLREVAASHPDEWLPLYLLAEVHLECRDGEAAHAALQELRGMEAIGEEGAAAVRRAERQLAGLIYPSRALEGHTKSVTAVSLGHAGHLGLSGGTDRNLRLWDVTTGRLLYTLQGHRDSVTRALVLPDDRRALSASADGTLRLWDLQNGKCLHVFEGHGQAVLALALSGDCRVVLSGSEDETFRLWKVSSGRCLGTYSANGMSVEGACLAPDGKSVLSLRGPGGEDEKTLHLWDLETGRSLRTFAGHRLRVTSFCLSGDGRRILSGSRDMTVKLWDVAAEECLRTFIGHKEAVTAVTLSADGKYALSGTDQGNLKFWDGASGECIRSYDAHRYGVTCVALSPTGEQGLSGSFDREVRVWPNLQEDLAGPTVLCRVEELDRSVGAGRLYDRSLLQAQQALAEGDLPTAARHLRQARVLPGYRRHADALDAWMDLYLWLPRKTLAAGWEGTTFTGHRHGVTSLALTLDGSLALSGSKDRTLKLWSVPGGRCITTLRGHDGTVWSVCLSADARRALSGSADGTVKLWSLASGRCLRTFQGHKEAVWSVCVTADRRFALSASWDRTMKLWETATGRCLRTMEGHDAEVNRVALSPDERLAVSASWDGTLGVWEIASGNCLARLLGHGGPVWSLSWSLDGSQLLSGGDDKTVRLWDVAAARCLRVLKGHTWQVPAVGLAADGRHALSGSWDRAVRLWDTTTGACLRTFEGHADKVQAVCVSSDGRHALTGSEDAVIKLWVLDWELEDAALADWDERALPYLENFLTLQTPLAATLRRYWSTDRDVGRALTRSGEPTWEESDFETLLYLLGCAGLGWLRPKGVQRKLKQLARR